MGKAGEKGQWPMKAEDFKEKDYVAWIPRHAKGDIDHRDVDRGLVSAIKGEWVFVKFFPALNDLGWEGTVAQACDPEQLIILCTHASNPEPGG
jgi:hypothetical protein